jgi:hypothetical protein
MVLVIFAPHLVHNLLLARSYNLYEKNQAAVHPAYHQMNQFSGLKSNDGQLRSFHMPQVPHTLYTKKIILGD